MKENYNPKCACCQSQKRREEEAQQEIIVFSHDGERLMATAKRFSDAFYEIVVGKYKGNLVHIFDVL